MPFEINYEEVVTSIPLKTRQTMIPNYMGDKDPKISVTQGCTKSALIKLNTDFAVVATDGDEIQEVIKAAQGVLGQWSGDQPTANTLISGISVAAKTVSDVLSIKPDSARQEIAFQIRPCKEKQEAQEQEGEADEAQKKYKVELEVFGAWVITDDEARSDPDEHASVYLLLVVDGKPSTWNGTHAKRTTKVVDFPFSRNAGKMVRFKTEVTTEETSLPIDVYAKCVESAQTNGPGDSAYNPLDILQDAFLNSVSAVRIDYITIKITELEAKK